MENNVEILDNPKGAFWNLSRPLLLLSLFQACYSLVDMFWVSQLSKEAFFVVGVAVPLIAFINGCGDSIGVGTNSIISREIGKNDMDSTYNSLLHGLLACAFLGVLFIIAIFFLRDILVLMEVKHSIDLAIVYLTPMFLFSFIFMFSTLFVSTLHAEGNSRVPTAVLILTNIMNLILDPVLIFVLDWGVAGVAYASILSSATAVLIFIYWYLSGRTKVQLNFRYFKFGIIYEIFVVAIPNFLINVVWCFSMMFINRILIEQLGQIGILLYSTSTKIESLIEAPQKSFSKSLLPITGQLFGANDFSRLKEIFRYVIKYSILVAIVLTVIFFFIRDYGFALYSVTGVEESVFYIALAGILIVPAKSVSMVSSKALDGLGKSYHSLTITIGIIVTQVGLISVLASILTSGVCVLVGILVSEVIFAGIYYILVEYLFRLGENDKWHSLSKN